MTHCTMTFTEEHIYGYACLIPFPQPVTSYNVHGCSVLCMKKWHIPGEWPTQVAFFA